MQGAMNTVEGFINTNSNPGVVTFLISRRLEGGYSCGTQLQRSYSIPFIGKLLVHSHYRDFFFFLVEG